MTNVLVRLGEVATSVMGQAPPGVECNKDGTGTPFVKAGEFGAERPVIREWTTKPLKLAKHSDVLLCVVGATCGKVNKGADCAIGRSVAAVRADEERLDRSYLYYFLSSWTDRLRAGAQGAAQTVITREMIGKMEIPLPPLPEQRRIAAILDKADALRAKRREAIAKLDQLLQSVFLDMFGDPVTNPKGWEQVTFGDLIKVKSGNGLIAKNMVRSGGYPVYGGNGVSGYHDKYMFDDPKIVIGRVGVYCGVIHVTQAKSWVTDNALYVAEVLREINPTFLAMTLKLAHLNQYAGRAAQPLVSGSRIYPVQTIFPPVELQNEYENRANRVRSLVTQLNGAADEVDGLFSSLQQRAFSGQLSQAA